VSGPPRQPPGLPRGISIAAVLCLFLSGVSGMFSAMEVAGLGRLSEAQEPSPPNSAFFGDPALAERMHKMQVSAQKAQLSALEGMKEPRALILGGLAVACAFVFVAAGRILRPGGLPREGMRRLLGGAAIAAAILRTLDGAQALVVVRRAEGVMSESMRAMPELQEPFVAQLTGLMLHIPLAVVIAQTILIAGSFALIGQFFHSARVREAVLTQDGLSE
jgi:hypothetical protein